MRVSLAIFFSVIATSSAFSAVPRSSTAFSSTGLHMSSPVKVPITITGDNVDLTKALSDYVNLKVDRTLGKLSSVSGVSHCDVFLTVNKNPKVNICYCCVCALKGERARIPFFLPPACLISNRLSFWIHVVGWKLPHCRGCDYVEGYHVPCRWNLPRHVCFYRLGSQPTCKFLPTSAVFYSSFDSPLIADQKLHCFIHSNHLFFAGKEASQVQRAQVERLPRRSKHGREPRWCVGLDWRRRYRSG